MMNASMGATLSSAGLVSRKHQVQVRGSFQASKGGYAFRVETKIDGDVYEVHVTLLHPKGVSTTVMNEVVLNETLNVPEGIKTVRVYDWRNGKLFETFKL